MNRSLRFRTALRGFTLIELLVVILILGILAALIVPKVISRTGQAKEAAAKSDESSIKSALNSFRIDCDRYPTDDEGLQALVTAPSGLESKWKSPYLSAVPPDPWGNSYIYHANTNGTDTFTIDCPATGDHGDIATSD